MYCTSWWMIMQKAKRIEKHLLFYEIMWYPLPTDIKQFAYLPSKKIIDQYKKNTDNTEIGNNEKKKKTTPTRTKVWTHTEILRKKITKRSWLYKSLPFVEHIYVCNSLSFNAAHEWSDIDLFIITTQWYIWRARIRSLLLLFLLWIKRSHKHHQGKFCLSFYMSEDAADLRSIKLPYGDIYLCYRLQHLIPLYSRSKKNKNFIYQHNKRIKEYFPFHTGNHIINIELPHYYWSTIFKKVIEKATHNSIGKGIQYVLKSLWLPILVYKKRKLQEKNRWIIISNTILKFHGDIRKKIQFLYENKQ